MFSKQEVCDGNRIELFLQQKLSDAELSAFESHLTECGDCCRRLESAAASEDIWRQVQDSLREQSPPDELGAPDSVLDSAGSDESSSSQATILKLLAPTDDDRMLGRWGTYEVVGVVGSGGMGVVLKALDAALNRYVAIKILAPHLGSSGAAIKRFSREGRASAAVVHDNVIEIYGVSEAAGLPYLVMPYVRGPSLQRRLDDEGPLAVVEILRVGMQAAAGLAAAHAQGLVHRDVKPANILLADGIERVKLTDFGLARAADDASLTRTGIIAGTPQYMSPEQARGEPVDQRSDLFSLGSVLYAMCTGRPPFRAETSYGVLRRITDEEPRPIREINPDVPDWLCGIVARLMAKRPDDRFQSASEVAALLEQCLAHVQQPTVVPLPNYSPLLPGEGQGVRVAGAHKPRPFAGWSRRKRVLTAAIGLLFFGGLGLALGILIYLKKDGKTTTVDVPEGSTAHIDTQGAVTVELPSSPGSASADGGKGAESSLERAQRRFAKEQTPEARVSLVKEYEKLLEAHPGGLEGGKIMLSLAGLCQSSHDYKKERAWLRNACAAIPEGSPDWFEAQFRLFGAIYLDQPEEARRILRMLIEKSPDLRYEVRGYYWLQTVASVQGKFDEMESIALKLQNIDLDSSRMPKKLLGKGDVYREIQNSQRSLMYAWAEMRDVPMAQREAKIRAFAEKARFRAHIDTDMAGALEMMRGGTGTQPELGTKEGKTSRVPVSSSNGEFSAHGLSSAAMLPLSKPETHGGAATASSASEPTRGLEIDVAAIGAQAAKLPKLIRAIRLRWKETGGEEGEGISTFSADGAKYRCEYSMGSLGGTPPNTQQEFAIIAYNGQVHQDFNTVRKTLTTSKKSPLPNQYGASNPLILPYLWVFRKGDLWSLDSMKNGAVWEERFKEARRIGTDRVDGHDCLVLGFPHEASKNCLYHVFLASDLGYFPLRWQRFVEPGHEVTTIMTVTKFKTYKTIGGTAVVPLVLEYEELGKGDASLRGKWTYTVGDDLQINRPVGDEVFTISTTNGVSLDAGHKTEVQVVEKEKVPGTVSEGPAGGLGTRPPAPPAAAAPLEAQESILSAVRDQRARQTSLMRHGQADYTRIDTDWEHEGKFHETPSTGNTEGKVYFDEDNLSLDTKWDGERSYIYDDGNVETKKRVHETVKEHRVWTKKWAAEWDEDNDVVHLWDSPGDYPPRRVDPRELAKTFVADPARLNVTRANYEGQACYRLEEVFPGSSVRAVQFLSPKRNFVLLRSESYFDNASRSNREKLREDYPFQVRSLDYEKHAATGVMLPVKCAEQSYEAVPLAEDRKPRQQRASLTRFGKYSFEKPPAGVFSLYRLGLLGARRLRDDRKGHAENNWYDLPPPVNVSDPSSVPDVGGLPPDLAEQWLKDAAAVGTMGKVPEEAGNESVAASKPETGQKQGTKWTPENIKKDPAGYLRWAIDRTDATKTKLEAAERALTKQRRDLSDKLQKVSADKSDYETFLKELEEAYTKADNKNDWPVEIRGHSFDKSELKRRIIDCREYLKNATKLVETYSMAVRKVADRLDENDRQRTKVETLRKRLATDLETAKVQQTLEGIDDVSRDFDDAVQTKKDSGAAKGSK